ncbi:MAG: ATP-binding protein, partial [Spirochaetaceae bacterium]
MEEPFLTLCECREKELSILQGWLEEVRISRQGKLVMVRGQSGVGKTSLLQTFTEYCKQDNSIETINFVCFADYLNMPLHPMRQWLSEFAGVQILNGDGGGSFPENKELSERIDGIALPGELTNSQIEKMQSDMLMVCKELCTAVCSSIKNEILLLIIDQFEWADALTFLVVQELCQWLSDYPVICVLSYSSLQPDTGLKCDDHLFNQIEIEPFSRNQAVCFVNAATSGETIFSEDILDLLYLNSLGMPGMLFHGINILREYHWPQDNELLQQLLTNLHPEALIKARLKSFEKKEVYLLSIAALIGMQVPLIDLQDLYHSISGIRNDVFVAGVMHKAAEEMIFRRIQSDIQERAEYIFFNDDVRQYLYAMLSDQEKSDFHLIFADSIADKQVYRAAYHYSFSNNRRKQLQYARAAYEL